MMASQYDGTHPEKVEKIVMIEPGILRPDLAQPLFDAQSRPGWKSNFAPGRNY